MDILKQLESQDSESVLSLIKKIINDEANPEISPELAQSFTTTLTNHPSAAAIICETIAFLGRDLNFRTVAASNGLLISKLVSIFGNENIDIQLQALRAVGNLCYNEDSGREQFLNNGGCKQLFIILEKCASLPVSLEYTRFKTVACGCLLNTCCDNEKLCQAMFDLNVLKPLCAILSKKEEESVLKMALQALSVLTECCDISVLSSSQIPQLLTDLLKLCNNNEYNLYDILLENIETPLSSESEYCDKWKVAIVTSGCVSQMLCISDSKLIPKVFDIIIQLASSDEALEILFTNDDLWSIVKSHMTNQSLGCEVRASATLVIANMARNDKNCESLVSKDIFDILSSLLEVPIVEENSKLHYAAMSALRNLSLPGTNKLLFLQKGIIDDVITVLNESDEPNVVIKAIGCLRILSSETEVCKHLCLVNPVIERVCSVSDNASFPHIKIEGSRLFVSLIKNSHSNDIITKVVEDGGTRWLIYLLTTDNLQLQNEGVIGLTITASLKLELFFKALVNSDITNSLVAIMENSSPEIIENCITLLDLLLNSVMKAHIFIPSMVTTLEKLCSHEKESIQKKAKELLIHQ